VWKWRANFAFQLFGASFSTFRMTWALFYLGLGKVALLDLVFVTYQALGFISGVWFMLLLKWKHFYYLSYINLVCTTKEEIQITKSKKDSGLWKKVISIHLGKYQ
jgi:hypothetical protein